MLSIQIRIDRAQRLLDMLEQDTPRLAYRFSRLTAERQRFAKEYATQLKERARAVLEKLREHLSTWDRNDSDPEPAD